jgi:hypothetical protein
MKNVVTPDLPRTRGIYTSDRLTGAVLATGICKPATYPTPRLDRTFKPITPRAGNNDWTPNAGTAKILWGKRRVKAFYRRLGRGDQSRRYSEGAKGGRPPTASPDSSQNSARHRERKQEWRSAHIGDGDKFGTEGNGDYQEKRSFFGI